MKRTVSLFLAAAMMLAGAMLFAGGQKAAPAAAEDPNGTLEITFITYTKSGYLPYDGNVIQKFLENKYNIKIVNVPIDTSGNQEQVNLFYATGGKFDVALHNGQGTRSMKEMAEDGVIRSFDIKLMRDNAPAMVAVLDKAFGADWPAFSTINGQLYSFPTYRPTENFGMAVRKDWLEKVGGSVNNLPKTIDELEALLLKFRENDPDGNGQKDTYALGKFGNSPADMKWMAPYVFGAYGVIPDRWNTGSDGGPVVGYTTPAYKEALARLASWYKNGILHPEVVTDTRQTAVEKFVAGKFGGYSGTAWQFSYGETGAPFGALKKANPGLGDDIRVILPPVSGPGGKAQTLAYAATFWESHAAYFGKNTSDAKIARLFKMWNDFVLDPEMYAMNIYGIKGQQYDLDADGLIAQRPEWTGDEKHTEYGENMYFINGWKYDGVQKYENDKLTLDILNIFNSFPALQVYPFDALDTEVDLYATVNPIYQEFALKVITGEWDVNREWDAYIARLNAAGLQKEIDAKKAQAREYGIIK
jgi:putative aldouronate transport system substrate-binding protein